MMLQLPHCTTCLAVSPEVSWNALTGYLVLYIILISLVQHILRKSGTSSEPLSQ